MQDPLPHRRLYPQLTVPPATELPNAEATLQLLRTAAGRNAYWASHRPHAFDGPVTSQMTAAQTMPASSVPSHPSLFAHPSISVGAQGMPHAIPLGVHIQQIEVEAFLPSDKAILKMSCRSTLIQVVWYQLISSQFKRRSSNHRDHNCNKEPILAQLQHNLQVKAAKTHSNRV